MVSVTIPSSDIEVAPFRTSAGATIRGRVTAEGGLLPPLVGQWIDVAPADAEFMPFTTPRPWTVRTGSDGSFEISGLQRRLRVVGTDAIPSGWWLKSVAIDGRNATDTPVTFTTRGLRQEVDGVLSTAGADISGRALDGRKEPVATYVAVAFAVERAHWYPGSRHLRAALPEADGEFRLGALPPGDYFVVALDRFDASSIEDSVVLQRLLPLARRVSISAGQGLTIDLPLATYRW